MQGVKSGPSRAGEEESDSEEKNLGNGVSRLIHPGCITSKPIRGKNMGAEVGGKMRPTDSVLGVISMGLSSP